MRLALLVLLVMDKFVRGEGRATAAGATRADDRIEILQGIAPNTDKDHLHRVLEHAGGNIEAAAEYLLSREAAMGGAGAETAASNLDPDAGANQPLALTESARPHCALHRPHAPSRAEMDEYLLSREAAMVGAGAAKAASSANPDRGAN